MVDDPNIPERPRVEPEIIPPDRTRGDTSSSSWPPYGYSRTRNTERIFVGRVGPFGIALLLLGIAFVAAVALLTLIGAVLIWFPVIAVLVAIAAIAGWFRRR